MGVKGEKMSLREFLLYHTDVGDLIWICDNGGYIGCTVIDGEDLFIGNLNSKLLKRKVKSHEYTKKDWTIKIDEMIQIPVLVVEVE